MRCEEEAEAVFDGKHNLPEVGVKFACAYGSRFAERSETSQLDMLLVVDSRHVCEWHRQNLQRNSDHYASWARYIGPTGIEFVQNLGPSIYYNVNAELKGFESTVPVLYKYGVIGSDYLMDDLTNWSYLYTAGRLQKPVYELKRFSDPLRESGDPTYLKLQKALEDNWRHALAAALLDLPERFSDMELYSSIVSLSYRGDVRMAVGENPEKISNIVRAPGNLSRFRSMYASSIKMLSTEGFLQVSGQPSAAEPIFFIQDMKRHSALVEAHLPFKFRELMRQHAGGADISTSPHVALRAAENTVRRYSLRQTAKGFLTIGPLNSVTYAARKILKNLRGRFRF